MAEAVAPGRGILDGIPGLRQLVLLVGLAGAIAAALWLVFWSQGSAYAPLYGPLSERETAQVADALTAAGIEYQIDPGSGTLRVPEAAVREARMRLAAQGLPASDALGVEMIQKESAFGSSQFMESARYQLALETELARTVVKVQGVQSARVHLALPRQTAFVRDRDKASASVMLQLYSGRRLEPGQVSAIVHLVASSVPNLEATDVTVVDQNGRLLNSPVSNDELSVTAKQIEYTRTIESDFERRIEDLLSPLLGVGRVRAGVTADVDFTQTEQTREDFDPQQQVVRSEQQSTDQRMAGDLAMGIPGALSNQPPETTPAPPAAKQQPATAQAPQPVATSERATRNYEIDRTISHVRQPTGTVRRLSVAVILDNKSIPGAEGAAATSEPLTQQDIDKYTSLVKDAVGFDEQRGDRVQIINAAFSPAAAQAEGDAEPWWQAPWLKDVARQGIGIALVLVLAFVVLRPIVKNLLQGQHGGARGGDMIGMGGDLARDRVTLSAGGPGGAIGANYEQQVAAARSLVGQDPRRAAQVVKEWVSTDGR